MKVNVQAVLDQISSNVSQDKVALAGKLSDRVKKRNTGEDVPALDGNRVMSAHVPGESF